MTQHAMTQHATTSAGASTPVEVKIREEVSEASTSNIESTPQLAAPSSWKNEVCYACGYFNYVEYEGRCRKFNVITGEDESACPDFIARYQHQCQCGAGFFSTKDAEETGATIGAGGGCVCWHCQKGGEV